MEDLDILKGVENDDATLANRTSPSWVPNCFLTHQSHMLQSLLASGRSKPQILFQENGVIQLYGAELGDVESVETFELPDEASFDELDSELRRLWAILDLESVDLGAFCLVLCSGIHYDTYLPPYSSDTVLKQSESYLAMVLLEEKDKSDRTGDETNTDSFRGNIMNYCL